MTGGKNCATMDTTTFFDFTAYMARLTAENRLARREDFRAVTCSGMGYLEGLLQEFQTTANFVATSDVCAETTFMHAGGWFKRRVFTVFLLMRYAFGDGQDAARKMALCRELFRQFQSRFIRDAEALSGEMLYLNTADIRSNELGGTFLSGCTGLYFMLSMDEPTQLCYDPEEWQSATE